MKATNELVYGSRDCDAIISRSKSYESFKRKKRFVSFVKKCLFISKNQQKIYTVVVLGIDTKEELLSFFEKCKWYLPTKIQQYHFAVEGNFDISSDLVKDNDFQVEFHEIIKHCYNEANLVLLNKAYAINSVDLIKYIDKVVIIDKEYFSYSESISWQNICYNSLAKEQKNSFLNLSIKNFVKFESEKKDKKKAYCFVTGPSFSEYTKFTYSSADLIVICNSIVKNQDFLNKVGQVDLLTFADPVFHFSYNKYSQVFRERVLDTFRRYRCYVVVPIQVFPLIYQHYPELREHLIGMIFQYRKGKYNIPSKNDFWVRDTGNILATLMLPMASVVADELYIIGADGRKPDEKYFWTHNPTVQFNDLMDTVFEAHPSFFRDRDYKDYYYEHCQHCHNLLTYAEKQGRRFASLTPSYIPVFNARFQKNIQTVRI